MIEATFSSFSPCSALEKRAVREGARKHVNTPCKSNNCTLPDRQLVSTARFWGQRVRRRYPANRSRFIPAWLRFPRRVFCHGFSAPFSRGARTHLSCNLRLNYLWGTASPAEQVQCAKPGSQFTCKLPFVKIKPSTYQNHGVENCCNFRALFVMRQFSRLVSIVE